MPFNINTFKSKGLIFGGARPSLFEVQFTTPPGIGLKRTSTDRFTFNCSAASLPPAAVSEIPVYYFGRAIKVAGDREFPDWQLNIMNDEDFVVRAMFEKWNNSLNAMVSNYRDTATSMDSEYKADFEVYQYGKDGDIIRGYKIVGAFPTVIGEIQLGWDGQNQIESFPVSIAYDYWVPFVDGGFATDLYTGTNADDGN